jgi:hypothetical protein
MVSQAFLTPPSAFDFEANAMLARGRSSIARLTVASPLLGQALADRMSWWLLEPVTKDSRRPESC